MISMMSNQYPLRYVTAMKLGLIPTEYGASSSVLASSFKVKKCGKCKLENKYHCGPNYLSLPNLNVNASCHPSLCTKPGSTPKISTIRSHWTGYFITHHLVMWIDTDG